jgi:hypothetical protein
MLNVSGVSNVNVARSVTFGQVQKTKDVDCINSNADILEDSFQLENDSEVKKLSIKDKQKILYNARKDAAWWSIVGGPFSFLYYGLSSKKTIAKKYDLNVEQDKKFIKQIRKEQAIAAAPSVIWGLGGLFSYIHCKATDPESIEIKQ